MKNETKLKELNHKIETLYNEKEFAKDSGRWDLAQQLNYELTPLIKEASELEFKINFN